MSFKLLAINGSLTSPPSRTRIVLDGALAGARAYDPSVETQVLELRDFAIEFCDGRSPIITIAIHDKRLRWWKRLMPTLLLHLFIVDHTPGAQKLF